MAVYMVGNKTSVHLTQSEYFSHIVFHNVHHFPTEVIQGCF